MHLVLEENSGLPTLQGAPISILCDNVQLFIVTTFIAGTGHHFLKIWLREGKHAQQVWFDTKKFFFLQSRLKILSYRNILAISRHEATAAAKNGQKQQHLERISALVV